MPSVPPMAEKHRLGAGMDTRAYRLSCLKDSDVFEVDFPEVMQVKTTILQVAKESAYDSQHIMSKAKSLTRVAADIRENDWLEKLQIAGLISCQTRATIWVLEGILYYLTHSQAMQVLKILANKCTLTHTVVLADFMNKSSTTLSNSAFQFYSDWPDHLLPSIGFTHVKLSQIGDPDAHFGLLNDPLNLFNKLRTCLGQFESIQTMEHHAVVYTWWKLLVHQINVLLIKGQSLSPDSISLSPFTSTYSLLT